MMSKIRKGLTAYFNVWWIPTVGSILSLGLVVLASLPYWRLPHLLPKTLLFVFALSLLGILANGISRLIQKKWKAAILQLVLFCLIFLLIAASIAFLVFFSLCGPSEDHFADQLTIPSNIAIAEPLEEIQGKPEDVGDAFQTALLATLAGSGTDDPSVIASLPSLAELQKNSPAMLKRYLATSPTWRLYDRRRAIFATRRWAIGGVWTYTLNGYYTRFSIDLFNQLHAPAFQSRVTLDFSGKSWAPRGQMLSPGQTQALDLTTGNGQPQSFCLLPLDGVTVELFEQSSARERRLTKAALQFLEEEFKPLAVNPTWETIQKILPPGSIQIGEASMALRKSTQPGIYTSEIWVNPGESGRIYLKAFEITHGTQLSDGRLAEDSNEWVGWSEDPRQQFFSNINFIIYNGDWGKPYAARFEVWFIPDSGKPERKLLEKNFKIEGWQR